MLCMCRMNNESLNSQPEIKMKKKTTTTQNSLSEYFIKMYIYESETGFYTIGSVYIFIFRSLHMLFLKKKNGVHFEYSNEICNES